MNEIARGDVAVLTGALGRRSVVLVGMMGAGKTSVGRASGAAPRLAPSSNADAEIEAGARMTISEIFERFGERYFRDGRAQGDRGACSTKGRRCSPQGGAHS